MDPPPPTSSSLHIGLYGRENQLGNIYQVHRTTVFSLYSLTIYPGYLSPRLRTHKTNMQTRFLTYWSSSLTLGIYIVLESDVWDEIIVICDVCKVLYTSPVTLCRLQKGASVLKQYCPHVSLTCSRYTNTNDIKMLHPHTTLYLIFSPCHI